MGYDSLVKNDPYKNYIRPNIFSALHGQDPGMNSDIMKSVWCRRIDFMKIFFKKIRSPE
jgi:hypothetical protein